jgi:hypothetical protein
LNYFVYDAELAGVKRIRHWAASTLREAATVIPFVPYFRHEHEIEDLSNTISADQNAFGSRPYPLPRINLPTIRYLS